MSDVEPDAVRAAIQVLEKLSHNGAGLDNLPEDLRVKLMTAAGQLSRPDKNAIRARNRDIHRQRRQRVLGADKQARRQTGIRAARRETVFSAPAQITAREGVTLQIPRNCYVCKAEYRQVHFFYDSMCASCAEFNYNKRFQRADLTGQVALITGARLKIGYQAALMMLRSGAHVIVTTRFAKDAAKRYAAEADFNEWSHRLDIHGLDLRHIPSVEIFSGLLTRKYPRLDILINNAAQTVRRPAEFYNHLMPGERSPLQGPAAALLRAYEKNKSSLLNTNLPAVDWHSRAPGVGILAAAELSQIPYSNDTADEASFPVGQLDADLQQRDLRHINSWRLSLAQVPTLEMLEVQMVNSIAPFVLCSRLADFMRRDPTGRKHIVNVSAMEGKFTRFTKTDKHPHTNMAKAALNMMTHTSARGLVKDGIFMNAVDTGWVTDEDPQAISLRKQAEHDFQPPLDIVDGAARVCDPFFHGILSGEHWCGKFLKDYFPTDW